MNKTNSLSHNSPQSIVMYFSCERLVSAINFTMYEYLDILGAYFEIDVLSTLMHLVHSVYRAL